LPIVKVWCLPPQTEEQLNGLHQDVVAAAVSVHKLGIKGKQHLTCLFPQDMMQYGLGSEVIVEISGLFEKPERTPQVIDLLAFRVGLAVAKRFPKAKVECLVYSFNPDRCFWTCKSYEDYQKQESDRARLHRENWADTGGGE
jgi:hypothetical protein